MAAKKLSPQARGAFIVAAAKKYGIPWEKLWGVYGVETSHGENVSTSSAGAKGGFQFIESTAKTYNYPYTNDQSEAVFAAQSDAAAHYLSDLLKQHGGNWDAALHAYSGGGYGQAQVDKAAKYSPPQKSGLQEVPGVEQVEGAANAVGEATAGVSDVLAALVDPQTWLRVAEGVGGIVLLAMGLKTLTRGSGGGAVAEAGRQARSGHQVIKTAAKAAVL